MCQRCGAPAVPGCARQVLVEHGQSLLDSPPQVLLPECRNTARRFRYRVAGLSEDSRYRVTGNRYALSEPVPCWRSEEWHLLAKVAIGLMEQGWVLTRELDFLEVERVTLADVREAVRPGPSQEA